MFKLSFIYIWSFCLILSLLSFFNIIYSYYFEIFNNIQVYSYTLIIALIFSSFSLIKKKEFKKISIYEKIIAVGLGYLIIAKKQKNIAKLGIYIIAINSKEQII